MKNNWEVSLARGEWFEDNVAHPWLVTNWPEWWITDCRLQKKSSLGGPKMRKGDVFLTLPDFRLDHAESTQSFWIDAKYKEKFFTLDKHPGERFTSIDPRSYQEYVNLMSIFPNIGFYALIGNKRTNGLYMLDLKSIQPIWHDFNNQYVRRGRSCTPCFPETMLEYVGLWNPTLMPI